MTSDLMDVYQRTTYWVEPVGPDAGERFPIRIGENDPDFDSWLRTKRVDRWAFISAWNPGSRLLPPKENDARHLQLMYELGGRGLPFWPGRGLADSGDWQEGSLLVGNLSADEARDLGRRFGQVAIVVGRPSAPAELLACETGTPRD